METNNKHTSGNWYVHYNMVKAKWDEAKGDINSAIICEMKYSKDLEANAKLIAASPLLLEALQEAKKELRLLNVNSEGEQKQNTPASLLIHKIEKAINQATQ